MRGRRWNGIEVSHRHRVPEHRADGWDVDSTRDVERADRLDDSDSRFMVHVNRGQKETHMQGMIRRLVRSDDGQDLIEYGLLVGIITITAIAAIISIGPKVGAYFTNLDGLMP
jgi:Flp pilus assembly pilin Flp